MTLHIGYWAALIDEVGTIVELDFSDEEWYCTPGCLDVALDGLNDRGWFPSPVDDGFLIGHTVIAALRDHPDDVVLWVAFPDEKPLPDHHYEGNELSCGACGSHVGEPAR